MNFQTFPDNVDLTPRKRVKFGIDPTFPRLHLGHLVPLRLVKKMIEDGHEVTIVLGTFTAQLGDPSGRDSTRPILSSDEVHKNADLILIQLQKFLGKILPEVEDPSSFNWHNKDVVIFKNHQIHQNMPMHHFMKIASNFTLTHMTSRNAFQDRINNNQSIAMHELLVPMLQGWDSVSLSSQIEIGGQDQLFNFQIARQLQEVNGQKPQGCILMPIINGTDGRKMSKSLGNCVFWDENPHDIFGKVMSIPDTVMEEWFPLFVDGETKETHPMEKKKVLAIEIVKQLHSLPDAIEANQHFFHTVQNKEIPDDMPFIRRGMDAVTILDAVVKMNNSSKTAARQLIKDGAIKVNGEKIFDEKFKILPTQIIQSGKRNFAKVE